MRCTNQTNDAHTAGVLGFGRRLLCHMVVAAVAVSMIDWIDGGDEGGALVVERGCGGGDGRGLAPWSQAISAVLLLSCITGRARLCNGCQPTTWPTAVKKLVQRDSSDGGAALAVVGAL
jgi:hypothetical protein